VGFFGIGASTPLNSDPPVAENFGLAALRSLIGAAFIKTHLLQSCPPYSILGGALVWVSEKKKHELYCLFGASRKAQK
jgi:hypothetical protein